MEAIDSPCWAKYWRARPLPPEHWKIISCSCDLECHKRGRSERQLLKLRACTRPSLI